MINHQARREMDNTSSPCALFIFSNIPLAFLLQQIDFALSENELKIRGFRRFSAKL